MKLAELLKNNMRSYGMIVALMFIILLFSVLSDGILLRPLNVTNLILQNSYILVLAIGMVMVIIAGHIDLSVGSVCAFVGAIAAILMIDMQLPTALAVLICLLLGALIGAWHGFFIAYLKMPSFIVTLAGMLLFRGLTMVVLGGQSKSPYPPEFILISSGFLPDIPFLGLASYHTLTMLIGVVLSLFVIFSELKERRVQINNQFMVLPKGFFIAKLIGMVAIINIFTFVLASYRGIPNILVILFVLIVLFSFVMNKTVIGRHIYATGGNQKAAELSGVKTKRVTFWVFVNMGFLSAMAGLIYAARLNSATPRAGTMFELDAIAAAFIGGASMAGGVGTIVGAVVGGLVMGVMNNGMSLLGISIDWQQAIKGLVLLAAVGFDIYNRNKAK
ncbi:sugar ABC transporter permease [Halalkalibacterium halodurans]|uniref:Xylose transport system permease protein XylH n=1 Tax=Halalkalibacterium halodurans (strain ATCC BAA-125 / DSM 18197 / FERM 7344 / JCM 9153 / C-125) TaxID=272558 RepID=Q9K7C4_HALH5|nr:multiple monosaccharide ABC transporter permease [Halalkalibacterium halodurans]MED4080129.1 sugar ABC transporter permease [Halalkalibacterium halodurans]MED4083352.1 sugar ABC transporter permease [Halalkalibacterium halodurans]MED4105094.1 sugar ABC transporter permease [Halalkalibacterium halodurans]MED4109412.1 sugar ABC transporter permease [Halalkalibacterium halodurans]MED4147262.1 sugar ABC transporter permease [Halalkalibacterium halodurans]